MAIMYFYLLLKAPTGKTTHYDGNIDLDQSISSGDKNTHELLSLLGPCDTWSEVVLVGHGHRPGC